MKIKIVFISLVALFTLKSYASGCDENLSFTAGKLSGLGKPFIYASATACNVRINYMNEDRGWTSTSYYIQYNASEQRFCDCFYNNLNRRMSR